MFRKWVSNWLPINSWFSKHPWRSCKAWWPLSCRTCCFKLKPWGEPLSFWPGGRQWGIPLLQVGCVYPMKVSSFDMWLHFGMLISKVTRFVDAIKLFRDCQLSGKSCRKSLQETCHCDNIFSDFSITSPIVIWGAAKAVWQGWKCTK